MKPANSSGWKRFATSPNSLNGPHDAAEHSNLLRCMSPHLAPLRHADGHGNSLLIGVNRKWLAHGQNDAIDPKGDIRGNGQASEVFGEIHFCGRCSRSIRDLGQTPLFSCVFNRCNQRSRLDRGSQLRRPRKCACTFFSANVVFCLGRLFC